MWFELLMQGDILFIDHKIGSYYIHDTNQLSSLDSSVQQWLELTANKLAMLEFSANHMAKEDFQQYLTYLKNNLIRAQLYAAMMRRKNPYAQKLHIKLTNLIKQNAGKVPINWTVSTCCFYIAYCFAMLLPEQVFSLYTYFRTWHSPYRQS